MIPLSSTTQELYRRTLTQITGKSRIWLFSPKTLVGISESRCMHYNPNPRLTLECYVHPSVIITMISSAIFVHNSNGPCTQYLRNHNVPGVCGILAHPAVPLLLFLMYHRSLVAYQYISKS
jgi:hypothetical protein